MFTQHHSQSHGRSISIQCVQINTVLLKVIMKDTKLACQTFFIQDVTQENCLRIWILITWRRIMIGIKNMSEWAARIWSDTLRDVVMKIYWCDRSCIAVTDRTRRTMPDSLPEKLCWFYHPLWVMALILKEMDSISAGESTVISLITNTIIATPFGGWGVACESHAILE